MIVVVWKRDVCSMKDCFDRLWIKLKTYFSGRLFIVQLCAGVGAFALRSLGAIIFDSNTVTIIIAGIIGSYTGYITTYAIGYWLRFRKDYSVSGRSMKRDILGLQSAEQVPNLISLIITIAWQGFVLEATDLPVWIGLNLASWFGPQKIVNLAAALLSNSLKRGWIDHSWLAPLWMRKMLFRIRHPYSADGYIARDSRIDNTPHEEEEEIA